MMYKRSIGERTFDVLLVIFFVLLIFIMLFPFYNVLVTSFVSRGEYYAKAIILWPEKFYLDSYKFILSSNKLIKSMGMTAFITIAGTVYSMFLSITLAYGLSRKKLPGRSFFLTLILFTMFFGGGLIPYYLLIRSLKLINTAWVMIIPVGINTWNFIVMKSFFSQIPESLEESATIDGANDLQILWKIILPLSLPMFATFNLFYGVEYWNTWWSAQLFITKPELHPIQLVLRKMVVQNELPSAMQVGFNTTTGGSSAVFEDGIRMATVIIATIPILCIYPFLQKYFTKGVMLGSIKG
jgi:putative aldouronate transport system permease protein